VKWEEDTRIFRCKIYCWYNSAGGRHTFVRYEVIDQIGVIWPLLEPFFRSARGYGKRMMPQPENTVRVIFYGTSLHDMFKLVAGACQSRLHGSPPICGVRVARGGSIAIICPKQEDVHSANSAHIICLNFPKVVFQVTFPNESDPLPFRVLLNCES
jgi:hypothetical protein